MTTPTLKLYRCTVCGTRWLFWTAYIGTSQSCWNLLDEHQCPGACCDNAPMGAQIEFLRDLVCPPAKPDVRVSIKVRANRWPS